MKYLVLSFSHKNAPIEIREKVSFEDATPLLDYLHSCECIKESIALSTCNRTEIFMLCNDNYCALQECFKKLSAMSSVNIEVLKGCASSYEGYSAIHHIFLVASSLDSLVVGETQIAGQLKKAYRYALKNGYCTTKGLGLVIDFAFKCAGSVRNETGISKNPVSIASIAVLSANDLPLNQKRAVVVSAGTMGKIAIKHLLGAKYRVLLLNRSYQKAVDFKNELNDENLQIAEFSELNRVINDCELLFSASSAQNPIITKAMIKQTPHKRYFYDLAIPRDIEEDLGENVEIFSIDSLQKVAEANKEKRKDSINIAYQIVGEQVNEFFKYLNILGVEPIIKHLRNLAKSASMQEIDKAIAKGFLPQTHRANLQKTIHNVFNVFLHTPTKNLKNVASTAQLKEIKRSLKILFELDDENLAEAQIAHDKGLETKPQKF
ncbi:glutamyl-tRNA reductase [Helicobacter sp. 23-1045]